MTSIYNAPLGRIRAEIRSGKITRIRELLTWQDEHGDGPHITYWTKLFDSKSPFFEKVRYDPLSLPISYGARIDLPLGMTALEIEILIAEDHLYYLKKLLSEKQPATDEL